MLNRKFLSTASIISAFGLTLPVVGSAAMVGFPEIFGGEYDYGYAISRDGKVVVGESWPNTGSGNAFVYRYSNINNSYIFQDIGSLGGTGTSSATGANEDGKIIVGQSVDAVSMRYHAFVSKFDATTDNYVMSDLGTLGSRGSYALGVSADGKTITGYTYIGSGRYPHAFISKYNATNNDYVMSDLGTLGGTTSTARAVSADGKVIVGESYISGYSLNHAFVSKYNASIDTYSMSDLGTLGGATSSAFAASADGKVIVGESYISGYSLNHAFVSKYNASTDTYSMSDLGTLGGTTSSARAVSADGKVIVGESRITGSSTRHAFASKYNAITDSYQMFDLGSLNNLNYDSIARGVSADGNTIVGYSYDNEGCNRLFIYYNFIMLDVVDWMTSIGGPAGILPIVSSLTSLPMEGAHHRPLMSLDAMGKASQVWVTGDFGARSRTSDSHTTSGEAGVSSTYGTLVAGVAVGYGEQNNDLLFGGSSHVSGQYLLGEIDVRLPDNKSIISLTAMFGDWKSDTLRSYGVGGGSVDFSHGSTNLDSASLRLRFDGPAQNILNGPSVTPFASFTWSRVSADAYSESGGSYDAQFNDQKHVSREGRLGLTSKFVLNPETTLLATAEWIHRFDKSESGFTGTAIKQDALAFDVAGAAITANQARFGLDVDHKLTGNTLLNLSLHVSGLGPAADVSGSLSIRRAF